MSTARSPFAPLPHGTLALYLFAKSRASGRLQYFNNLASVQNLDTGRNLKSEMKDQDTDKLAEGIGLAIVAFIAALLLIGLLAWLGGPEGLLP